MPLGIKVASAFFFVYAAVGLIWGFSYWYLIGVVITISLFLPSVGKAPTLPSPASGGGK